MEFTVGTVDVSNLVESEWAWGEGACGRKSYRMSSNPPNTKHTEITNNHNSECNFFNPDLNFSTLYS